MAHRSKNRFGAPDRTDQEIYMFRPHQMPPDKSNEMKYIFVQSELGVMSEGSGVGHSSSHSASLVLEPWGCDVYIQHNEL